MWAGGVLSSYSSLYLSVLLIFMGKRVCSINFAHVNSFYPCCFGIQIVSFILIVCCAVYGNVLKWTVPREKR